MAGFRVAIIAIVVIAVFNSATARIFQENINRIDEEDDATGDVQVHYGNINNFKAAFPLPELETLRMESHVRGRINYTLGSRVRGK